MIHGDFTTLAKHYIHRPAYSAVLLEALLKIVNYQAGSDFTIAEIGAGTGKFTQMLAGTEARILAVEPNDAMRAEGQAQVTAPQVQWLCGSGEATGLPEHSADWVVMASSFHWTDPSLSLPEFHRILKPGGYFTALWNPRNIDASPLHQKIEETIYAIAPDIRRVSSGRNKATKAWESVITTTGHFKNVLFAETDFEERMSQERYMGAWQSVNDIQTQAGEERWGRILDTIEQIIASEEVIPVPYKMRSWTAQRVDDVG